jgi:hypothetical protein
MRVGNENRRGEFVDMGVELSKCSEVIDHQFFKRSCGLEFGKLKAAKNWKGRTEGNAEQIGKRRIVKGQVTCRRINFSALFNLRHRDIVRTIHEAETAGLALDRNRIGFQIMDLLLQSEILGS